MHAVRRTESAAIFELIHLFHEPHVGKKHLEILNVGALAILRLKDGVEPRLHAGLIVAKALQLRTILELLVGQPKHLHGLRVCYETPFDSESLVGHLLAYVPYRSGPVLPGRSPGTV